MTLMLFGSMLLLMFIGLPVAFSMLVASLTYVFTANVPIAIVAQRMMTGTNSFILLAIPLFTLTGYIMENTSLSSRLVEFVEAFFGKARGSIGMVTIVSCAIFAALTGSGPATVAAIGALMMPAMIRSGYSRATGAGIIAAGGALGPIIPPSANMIVYGSTMNLSIPKMFIGGVVPGLFITAALCVVNYFIARKRGYKSPDIHFSRKEKTTRFLRAIPTLLIPVLILGGIYGGIVTPTEAAVLSVVYSLVYGLISKEIKLSIIGKVAAKTAITSATVVFILSVSNLFSWVLSTTRLPAKIGEQVMQLITDKYTYLAVFMLTLFIVGTLMDTIPAIVILAPILVPIGINMGVDPLHLGVLFCITLTVGFVTPPYGINLFTAVSTTGVQYGEVVKGVLPFTFVMMLCVAICAFIPELITWLPSLMF